MTHAHTSADTHDERHAQVTAWCHTCHSTQPCAPGGPPYRCLTCGTVALNPVLRFTRRHHAVSPALAIPEIAIPEIAIPEFAAE